VDTCANAFKALVYNQEDQFVPFGKEELSYKCYAAYTELPISMKPPLTTVLEIARTPASKHDG
jgi:hypothetical protein